MATLKFDAIEAVQLETRLSKLAELGLLPYWLANCQTWIGRGAGGSRDTLMMRKKSLLAFNRWIVLFWGIVISFVLLMAVPEEYLVFRSISITLIAILSIGYYLYKRYSKELTLQADLLISVNTLAQFLLPVLYLAFFYHFNSDLDNHNYRHGYALTSFTALLGQTTFYLGYESIRKSIYFPRVQITENSYLRLFFVLLPLLTLIWIGRFSLLSSGSYYHIHRTDYQFTSPFYSVFAQLSGYGLIVVGALFLIAFSEERTIPKRIKFVIAAAVATLEMLWYVPAGSREYIAFTILASIFAYIYTKRTIPKKAIAVLAIVSFPLLAVFGEYRYVASTSYHVSRIDLRATPSALLLARERLKTQDINIVANITDRFYDGKSLGYLLMHYSNDYDYELGRTYKNIPFSFIPRFIYPDKPIFTTALNEWYVLLAGGSMPITFWGESYINFSWFGIVIMSYLLGLAMKGYDYIFIKRAQKPYWAYLYIFSAVYIMRLPMQATVIWVSFLLKAIVLAFIFTGIHSGLTKVVSRSTRFAAVQKKHN